jgi:hypothetical protein
MARPQNLLEFEQSEFTGSHGRMAGLDNIGYLYVPTACQNKEIVCRLHIAFHGCWMSRGVIGTQFVEHSGYNKIAEVNNIIVLYPQTRRSFLFPRNPSSCYDWYSCAPIFQNTHLFHTTFPLYIPFIGGDIPLKTMVTIGYTLCYNVMFHYNLSL